MAYHTPPDGPIISPIEVGRLYSRYLTYSNDYNFVLLEHCPETGTCRVELRWGKEPRGYVLWLPESVLQRMNSRTNT